MIPFLVQEKLLFSSVLEEFKYIVKEKKIPKYIMDDIEISSDSNREYWDEENSNEVNSNEYNSNEENSNEGNTDEEN